MKILEKKIEQNPSDLGVKTYNKIQTSSEKILRNLKSLKVQASAGECKPLITKNNIKKS